MNRSRSSILGAVVAAGLCLCGCRQWFLDDADREVASLVQKRQMAALGFTTDTSLDRETGGIGSRESMYAFVPSPTDSVVPDSFRRATTVSGETEADASAGDEEDRTEQFESGPPADAGDVEPRPFKLSDALAYAMGHSRMYQTEKEALYLSALDLTLERYLWTPRFVESVLGVDYADAPGSEDFDQSLDAVSNFAIEQRLPYGGEITARVINTLVHDITGGLTTGESGAAVIEARLPLLRGAGPAAYESRYQSERNLIYAIRRFERFRREFLVDIAGDFFELLSLKAQIDSAVAQIDSLKVTYDREQALADAGRILQIEADRARVSLLNSENGAVDARVNYQTSLDNFKIRMGMPTSEPIDVVDEYLDLDDPVVSVAEAIDTALRYRLDLINVRDAIDDARRQVDVARNNLLPQVDVRAGVGFNTDSIHFNSVHYNSKLNDYSAGISVEVPLDRKRERNDYRSSIIALRRAERDEEGAADTVRLQVRRALRRLEQTRLTIQIQQEQIRINEFRAAQAEAKLKAGQLPSNRDVVDAQNDLRDARNALAAAQADFRSAVLEFLRDTGTLRIGNDGHWTRYDGATGEALTPPEPADTDPKTGP